MSDWGKGATNNDIGWGQGAVNNDISWGLSHSLSYSGDTDIVGARPLLLDLYPNAAAAYSLRRLNSDYTGDAIRVRRASDNTELNIGFVNNEFDTASLTTFCSGTDGFVTTWYDQSGEGNHATQTTASSQPKIYDSVTGVILENGKPALDFDGVDDELVLQTQITYTNQSVFSVLNLSNNITTSTNTKILYSGVVNGNATGFYFGSFTIAISNERISVFSNPSIRNYTQNTEDIIAGQYVYSWVFNLDLLEMGLYQNSELKGQNTNIGSIVYPSGLDKLFDRFNDNAQEIVIYPTYQNTNRVAIETNINDFYNIY